MRKPVRAIRTNPTLRKREILVAAMNVAAERGHNHITRDGVAAACRIASSTVAKYYRTMRALKLAVFKEAVRLSYMPVLQHSACDPALDKFPEVRRLILDHLRSRL